MKRSRRYRRKRNQKRSFAPLIAIILIIGIIVFCIFQLKKCDSFVPVVNKLNLNIDTNDMDASFDPETATHINFNGNAVEIKGDNGGASAQGQTITLSKSGTYVLTGTLSSGKILVSTSKNDGPVQIVLNGVSLTNTLGTPLMIMQSEKTYITVAENTQNSIIDASVYTDITDNEDAALFSKDDITINGTGKLVVMGNYRHGIVSKNDLKICSADIEVTSKEHGLVGRDVIAATDASFKLTCGGDGMQADNIEDATLGNALFDNCSIVIDSKGDAIQSEGALQASNSSLALISGGSSVIDSTSSSWGTWGTASSPATSAKGLKGNRSLLLDNSSITVDSSDDAIASSGNVEVYQSTLSLLSGDNAIASSAEMAVKTSEIEIKKSFDGLSASKIALYDSNVEIASMNDGINTFGGNNAISRNGAPSYNESFDKSLRVENTKLLIASDNDGIDVLGNFETMGESRLGISVKNAENNKAVSLTKAANISKDTEFVVTANAKESAYFECNRDNVILAQLQNTVPQNTIIGVFDDNDKSVMDSVTSTNEFNAVYAYSKALKKSKVYTLFAGNTNIGDVTAGISESSGIIITSAQPTIESTIEITPEITVEVTVLPTLEPTIEPTVEPTVEPTLEVTPTSTIKPTPTPKPTVKVTPTLKPTVKPTVKPTTKPTVKPTQTVKPTVTVKPTQTVKPTVKPTDTSKPTTAPSTSYILDKDFKMIKGVSPKTTCLRFKVNASKLGLGDFTILDLSGNEVSDMNTYVGTGFKLRTASGQTYKIIVSGDGNGDGIKD